MKRYLLRSLCTTLAFTILFSAFLAAENRPNRIGGLIGAWPFPPMIRVGLSYERILSPRFAFSSTGFGSIGVIPMAGIFLPISMPRNEISI